MSERARLPLRVRLVAGFISVMTLLLAGAGAFVYWRVQVDLDNRLNVELADQASTVQQAWDATHDPTRVTAALPAEALAQVLDPDGMVLAHSTPATAATLLPPKDLPAARSRLLDVSPGNLLTSGNRRLRVLALPLDRGVGQPPLIAVIALRLGQHDEALRELLAQLAVANLTALAVASMVGYRLTQAALQPVEQYRTQAEQIVAGAAGVRLEVPVGVDDEITRLGHTLNRMLAAQEDTAEQQLQFLADASHELRSPLTVLTSEVELALRRPRAAVEYEQTLQQVALDAAQLVTLADQLLDLEHATRPTASTDATDATAAAEQAGEKTRALLTGTGRAVTVSGTGPTFVPLAGTALDQILRNLLDNAVVHGTGVIALTVATALSQDSGETVHITVSDEGPGPPAGFTAHAIERFRRADPARTTPGNGLGLAVVHSLVMHAGAELRLCTTGSHHRYPPHRFPQVDCTHPSSGTHLTVIIDRISA
jgi:signal transduction histidine kinase